MSVLDECYCNLIFKRIFGSYEQIQSGLAGLKGWG